RWHEVQASALPTYFLESGCSPVFSTISFPSATTLPSSPGGSASSAVELAGSWAPGVVAANSAARRLPNNRTERVGTARIFEAPWLQGERCHGQTARNSCTLVSSIVVRADHGANSGRP